MDDRRDLKALAAELGVHTRFADGLGREVEVGSETLVRVCRALGAELDSEAGAGDALAALRESRRRSTLPPVRVAWDGALEPLSLVRDAEGGGAELHLEGGGVVELEMDSGRLVPEEPLPPGYHRLRASFAGREETCTVISAPIRSWRDGERLRSWGIGTQLAALRSARSRSLGDLRDFERVCEWVGERGGDLVAVLPLLPTFNEAPAEPSPYSPVSRLFWSELVLDLGEDHRPTPPPDRLDVTLADAEVRRALASRPGPDPDRVSDELARYAAFRGAQRRLGRNWRDWPAPARAGALSPDQVDPDEERFHRLAQLRAHEQLMALRDRIEGRGVRLGLDLAVGAHPDGYDTWSRGDLFAPGMSVGAPPDRGFPSGQDWGFSPVSPERSRLEGHRYLASAIAHQAELAGVLRIDHVMALTRLYWIPHGFDLDRGTYVSYPAEELFAVLCLESVRNRCEVVGENLGVVPPEVDEALARHGIRGMSLALFEADAVDPRPPGPDEVAMIGTHDTPTLVGWVEGRDIAERVRCGLLDPGAAPAERKSRNRAHHNLARRLGQDPEDVSGLLDALLEWLGRSESPLVIPWFEDFWLEPEGVNIPGTGSAARPNWQRPVARVLDDLLVDDSVIGRAARLEAARRADDPPPAGG